MTRVTCSNCQHWTAPSQRRGLGTCAKELVPELPQARHWCVFHKEHAYASRSRLQGHALPYLPTAIAAIRRPARSAADQVPPGKVSADRAATPARRTVRKVARQASLTEATLSEALKAASRTRGVKSSRATEPNCKDASPATGQ